MNEKSLESMLSENNIHKIQASNEQFPSILLQYDKPPEVLYCRGDMNLLTRPLSVGIVGSRHPSAYGKKVAYECAKYLSDHGVTIISGMAMGIDSYAHRGALESSGQTIAVMATGTCEIYPKSNAGLYKEILEKGLIVSEKPLFEKAMRYDFPLRNRIISGLSDIVIIIEASEKSGSLITAKYAMDQNKTIFALPGSIFSAQSKGTNQLIYDGALPLLRYSDVLEALGMTHFGKERQKPPLEGFLPDEKMIFELIFLHKIISIKEIVKLTQLTEHVIYAILGKLAMEELCEWVSLTEVASSY